MLLLKSPWSGLRVPNRNRLAVFGSFFLRDAARNLCEIERRWIARNVRKTLRRMIITALKWTLLTTVFIGKNKTKWGKVKSSTHIRRIWKNSLTELPRCY